MNIIKRFDVTEKWHSEFKREMSVINEIVVHGTGGGNSAYALMDWILSGEREDRYRQGIGLFHFIIDYDGQVFQIAPLTNWFYHSSCMKHDYVTIGIELMNKSILNENEYTEEQYKSLFELLYNELLIFNEDEIYRIVGHDYNGSYYSNITKGCPGNFDWNRLYEYLIGNFNVHTINYKNQQGLKVYV